ncbi:MAG: hypothetical protein ACYDIB_11380 [Desulfobulbia bacterium]
MKKKGQDFVQSKNGVLKVDLTSVEIDNKGRVIINDTNLNKKVKSIRTQAAGDQTKGKPVVYCADKLCIDVTCTPPPNNGLCGCMPNKVVCGCPPIPNPNHGCIPLGKKAKGK